MHLYVKYKTRLTTSQLNQEKSKFGLTSIIHATKRTDLIPSAANVVVVENGNINQIKQDPNVVLVEEIPVYEPNQFNDPIANLSLQTNDFNRVDYLEAIEEFGAGNHYPTVGQSEGRYEGAYMLKTHWDGDNWITDYFERYDHPDMPDSKVTVYNEELLPPLSGGMWVGSNPRHAFSVASIIIGETNNNYGMASYCPNCSLFFTSFYLSTDAGLGSGYGFPEQCEALVEQGIKVVNASYGTSTYSQVDNDAVNDAYEQGLVWVAGAGNDNDELGVERNQYPCMFDSAFCVAGSEYSNSNYGLDYCDVSAPSSGNLIAYMNATNVSSCYDEFGNSIDNEYIPGLEEYGFEYCPFRQSSGTSFGTPIVTALMGLLLSHNPDLTNQDLVDIVLTTIGPQLGGNQPVPGEVNFYDALSYMYENYMGDVEPLIGDINQDGIVNILDVVTFVDRFVEAYGDSEQLISQYPEMDINNDGIINVLDLVVLLNMVLEFESEPSMIMKRIKQQTSRLNSILSPDEKTELRKELNKSRTTPQSSDDVNQKFEYNLKSGMIKEILKRQKNG